MTTVPKSATPSTLDAVNALDQSLKEIGALSIVICASGFMSNDAIASTEKLFTLVRMITEKAEAAQRYADCMYKAWLNGNANM